MDTGEKIFFGFFIMIILLLGVCVYFCIEEDREQMEAVERCFMQEPRTKECELVLYKYENRKKNTTTAVPVFMPIRH